MLRTGALQVYSQLVRPCSLRAKHLQAPLRRHPTLARRMAAQCQHCSASTPKLTKDELEKALSTRPNWALSEDGTKITRSFVAKNWEAAMSFFNKLSEVAEGDNHHPDIHLTGYRNVQVDLQTHVIGGYVKGPFGAVEPKLDVIVGHRYFVAEIDIELADKLDAIEVVYSPKWLKEHLAKQQE